MQNRKGKWNISGFDRAEAVKLCREGVNPLISVLLASRNMLDREKIGRLLAGQGAEISAPFLTPCPGMIRAVERIRRAIRDRENVAIYGDYDVDGVTSTCLMKEYLDSKGLDCRIYIPDRLENGYGVKIEPLRALAEAGVTLVITVDCGVTAIEEIEFANSIGLDVIITDHHEQRGDTPDAAAVIDPAGPEGPAEWRILAGVGVAFKLACALEWPEDHAPSRAEIEAIHRHMIDRFGDLVALGTVADVMPMTGENRTLVNRGIEVLRRGNRIGIRELCSASGICEGKLKPQSIGFTLAPRINAAGRLGCTDAAVELMGVKDELRASRLAAQLCQLNTERQALERTLLRESLARLEKEPPTGPIVLASDAWHQDVSGIVASRLAEKFALPTVIICIKGDMGSGSCRSANGFNLYEALANCSEHLVSFGGHEMAAGLQIARESIPAFAKALGDHYAEVLPTLPEPTVRIDLEVLKPQLLSVENVEALDLLEPYGIGNPLPTLCMRDVTVKTVLPLSTGKHTKLWVEKCGRMFDAVYFSKSPEEMGVRPGMRADIAFNPQINNFRGQRDVQLNLVDFRAAE